MIPEYPCPGGRGGGLAPVRGAECGDLVHPGAGAVPAGRQGGWGLVSDCSVMITLCSVLLRALTGRAGGGQGGEHPPPAVHRGQRVGSAGTAGLPTH